MSKAKTKPAFSIKQQFIRTKKVVGMTSTITGAFRAMHRIGAFKEPPRAILPPYVQTFCRKMAGSFDIDVVQVEPVPKNHALWASNHLSWMDIPAVGSVCPAFFLAKAEMGEWFLFGKLMKASGQLLIKRGSGDAGDITTQLTGFLKDGHSIIFFPEGTTTDGTQIKRVHGKLLQSAMDAGVPIQPVVVCYANPDGTLSDALPYYGKQTMKDSMKKVMDSKNVTAYVLPLEEIPTGSHTKEQLTDILQKRMEDGLVELHKRVLEMNSPKQLTSIDTEPAINDAPIKKSA